MSEHFIPSPQGFGWHRRRAGLFTASSAYSAPKPNHAAAPDTHHRRFPCTGHPGPFHRKSRRRPSHAALPVLRGKHPAKRDVALRTHQLSSPVPRFRSPWSQRVARAPSHPPRHAGRAQPTRGEWPPSLGSNRAPSGWSFPRFAVLKMSGLGAADSNGSRGQLVPRVPPCAPAGKSSLARPARPLA